MIEYQILIDGVDYTSDCTLPFKEQYLLNTALDNGVITLLSKRNEIFKPFTKITIKKNFDEYDMLIASDKMTHIIGTEIYTHDLTLIEETKKLERKVVDTNTTTQPLIHDYFKGRTKCLPDIINVYSYRPVTPDTYINPLKAGETFIALKVTDIYPNAIPSDTHLYIYKDGIQIQDITNNTNYNFIVEDGVIYKFRYDAHFGAVYPGGHDICEYTFLGISEQSSRNKKSITDVVNRLLSIADTIRENESPAFVFNQEQADYYNQKKTVWQINDTPDTTYVNALNEKTSFRSNNQYFGTMYSQNTGLDLYYDNILVYSMATQTWTDNAYKTIEIIGTIRADIQNFLDNNATKISEEPLFIAPEFSMTKSTLRECLDQVGSYIHCLVRLKGNEIYFDKLGGDEETTLTTEIIGEYETLDCEEYASQLDTIVSNITNIDDESTGTIVEPFYDEFKTVRAESGTLRIGDGQNDTTCIIETAYPIEKVLKLTCGFITVNGETIEVGDITPYVYESAEYGLLSSFEGTFPNAKGYAITYTQGEKNITGLTFKMPNALGGIFSNQAILNIISMKIGQNVQSLFNVQDMTELQFQIIYFPSTTARVKQSRTDINNYAQELTTIYNQSANKVDSRAYGENLKGTIARIGNIEKFITYTLKDDNVFIFNEDPDIHTPIDSQLEFRANNTNYHSIKTGGGDLWYDDEIVYSIFGSPGQRWRPGGNYKKITFKGMPNSDLLTWMLANGTIKTNLPEVGSYVEIDGDSYYIATINLENELDYQKVTIGLSKDFNALSKYIGVSKNIRMYEISEKQTVDRFVTCEDYCVIGVEDDKYTTDNLYVSNSRQLQIAIQKQFVGDDMLNPIRAISCVEIIGEDVEGNIINPTSPKLILPIFSLGLGNSIWFGCSFEDNYSAGNQSVDGDTQSPSDSNAFYRLNQPVRYADYFGEIEKIEFYMVSDYFSYKLSPLSPLDTQKGDTIEIGNTLPRVSSKMYNVGTISICADQNNKVILKKDNREKINLSYQLHFVTNDNIIIGSQLSQGNPLVSSPSENKYAYLYVLPYKLNKFRQDLELKQTNLCHSFKGDTSGVTPDVYGKITFANQTAHKDGKSWAMVDAQTGKLLFGKNMDIKNGDTIELPTFTFTHKF